MKKLRFAILICLLTIGVKVSAQSPPVPTGYSLKTKDDYAKYEPDVIKVVDWLQTTPWTENSDEIAKANTFVIAWLSGSPNINLDINSDDLMKLCTKNGQLLVIFMGAYVKYALQNKDSQYHFDTDQAMLAALRAIIAKYEAEPSHVKDKNVERLAQLDKDGKLEDLEKTSFNKATHK